MFRKRSPTVLLGLLLCAASAAAQVNVTLQLPFAQMPSRVAEWRENESLIRIVVQNTGREQYEGLMLSVELSKDGRRIARSRNGHPAQPRFSLRPGETRSLSWREVISEEAVEYDGSIRQQVVATGELPEGQYRLCVQVLNAQLRPISPQACGSFGIVLADPPVLVSPIGGAQASPTPLLQWRPSNPPAPGLQYQVTVKVRYRGQKPAQAMASNPVRLQATVPTTSYQVPVTEQLGVDATDPNYAGHVWQVQALLNGRPYGRNRGLSQIEWFVVPPIAVDTVKPSGGRPIAVVEWEVPYEEIRPGRPIKLQVPPIQEDTVLYVLRVRVPEKLSLQELEQLRKNWAHEVRKEISAERTHQDTFVVQSYPPKYATVYFWPGRTSGIYILGDKEPSWPGRESGIYGMGQDTAGAGVDRTRYTGGFFLFRVGQDTFAVQRFIPERIRAFSLFPQDTAGVQGVFPGGYYLFGTPQDTAGAGVDRTRYTGGFYLFGLGQDTFGVQYWPGRRDPVILGMGQDTAGAGIAKWYGRYVGGYFLYALPQDTTKPAELVDYYVPNGTPQDTTEPASAARINIKPLADRVVVEPAPAEERQIAYNAGVEGAIIAERRGNVLVVGNFTPTHVGLPMPELELDPGDGPVCGIPGSLGQGEETVGSTARYTGYVLNQAIASGAGRPTGKTLGAVTRQAPPQGGNQNMGRAIRQQVADLGAEVEVHRMAGPISLPRPSDVGLPEFRMMPRGRAVSVRDEIRTAAVVLLRMMPPGGGAPVLWPNGNPPRDPDWPWVGVIGTPVLEGIDGAPGPGKPQNWCGTEYIWTGPPPKSPKGLILTPVIPRPR
jgi:hypothetical protein